MVRTAAREQWACSMQATLYAYLSVACLSEQTTVLFLPAMPRPLEIVTLPKSELPVSMSGALVLLSCC